MEISEKELDKLVTLLKEINNFVNSSLCYLEDMKWDMENMEDDIEKMLDILADVAKQAEPDPS